MRIYAPLNSEAIPILQEIEIATSIQIPSFHIIGLPNPEVAEAKERIRSAIESCGFEFPRKRVILNLSPASIRKRGTGLDLAMALAVLEKERKPSLPSQERIAAWGELSLDGTVKSAAQITRSLFSSWAGKVDRLLISESDFDKAHRSLEWILKSETIQGPPPQLIPVRHLTEAWEALSGKLWPQAHCQTSAHEEAKEQESCLPRSPLLPLTPSLERLICIAILGQHHLILLGPKGVGKSQALEWLSALQPQPHFKDRLTHALIEELNQAHSHTGTREEGSLHSRPWIRKIGTHAKPGSLIGRSHSGTLHPGEYSLAHGGVLIADELLEWARDSRESLREPLEKGVVTLTRANGRAELPARFLLAATGNLCPCGGLPPEVPIPSLPGGLVVQRCDCLFSVRKKYFDRLSGPILDRIDLIGLICSEVAPPSASASASASTSADPVQPLQHRIQKTQEELKKRWTLLPGLLPAPHLEKLLEENKTLRSHLARLSLGSLRSRHKVLRIALSAAAWDGISLPTEAHFVEAFRYRHESILGPFFSSSFPGPKAGS